MWSNKFETDRLVHSYYDMGADNFKAFNKYIIDRNATPISLNSTHQMLEQRKEFESMQDSAKIAAQNLLLYMCENAGNLVKAKISEQTINSNQSFSQKEMELPDVSDEGSKQESKVTTAGDLQYEYSVPDKLLSNSQVFMLHYLDNLAAFA